MFEIVELTLIDDDPMFKSTRGIMYGENIIRVKVKGAFKFDKHIYLNDKSFTSLVENAVQPDSFNQIIDKHY